VGEGLRSPIEESTSTFTDASLPTPAQYNGQTAIEGLRVRHGHIDFRCEVSMPSAVSASLRGGTRHATAPLTAQWRNIRMGAK
jgi:hypothetical protein